MAKTEKIAYILEQVRLCLDRKDFVRAQVGVGSVGGWNGGVGVGRGGLMRKGPGRESAVARMWGGSGLG